MPDATTESLHQNSIVIDGLVISNWSRDVFEQMHRGGLTAMAPSPTLRETAS